MLTLRNLRSDDIAIIKSWPHYPAEFSDLDYALRDDGWLDHYPAGVDTVILVAEDQKGLIGFSILSRDEGKCPEFRIALHPEKIGKGLGNELTHLTLAYGFSSLDFGCIRLIVRKNNHRAQKLYKELFFQYAGECTEDVQGKPVDFFRMEISREKFLKET
jgi:diamine N-acetyltransferase